MNQAKVNRRAFSGWADFVRTVSRPASADVRTDKGSEQRGSHSWTLGVGYDKALEMAITGWGDGFKRVSLKADAIKSASGGMQLNPKFADSGDDIDVGLFLEHEPECWVEYPMEPKRAPVVKLVVSAAFSAGVAAEFIYNRGAAILAAIDLMEVNGVRVEVDMDISLGASGQIWRHTIPLKAAGDALDRDKLAFAICHPATLRRLGFRLNELDGPDEWELRGGYSYGSPLDPEECEGSITVPAVRYGDEFKNMECAAKYAEELIAKAAQLAS